MRKVIILGLIALLLGVFAYFTLFYVSSDDSMSQTTSEQNEEAGQLAEGDIVTEPRSGVGTLEAVRLWGENVECTVIYTPDDQNTTVEGTYFVSEGNIRGDFLTEAPDLSGEILSSMIIDGSMMYLWSEIDGEVYGMKMDITEVEDSEIDTNASISLNDEVRYTCKPWPNVDPTIFVPPGDVLFRDLGELMKAGIEEGVIYEEGADLPF